MAPIGITALIAAFAVSHVKSDDCEDDAIFFQGQLEDIHLVDDESMELLLEITANPDVYTYCRILNLQSGDMSFEEVSCTKNTRNFEPFPTYDVSVTPSSNSVDVTLDGESVTLSIDEIDSDEYAYFYSPSMMSLFIFTSNTDNSAMMTTDLSWQLNLVSISWQSSNLSDYQYSVQYDIIGDAFPADLGNYELPSLNGEMWRSYDDDDMFMVEVPPSDGEDYECEGGHGWLRYSFLDDLYLNARDDLNLTMQFEYIGNGFIGVDTRVQRAFGFNKVTNSIWYYEADGDALDEWRSEEWSFEDAEMTSYWVVMFMAIGLFVLYCCCCGCCIWHSKRRGRKDTYDTTNDTEMYSTYV